MLFSEESNFDPWLQVIHCNLNSPSSAFYFWRDCSKSTCKDNCLQQPSFPSPIYLFKLVSFSFLFLLMKAAGSSPLRSAEACIIWSFATEQKTHQSNRAADWWEERCNDFCLQSMRACLLPATVCIAFSDTALSLCFCFDQHRGHRLLVQMYYFWYICLYICIYSKSLWSSTSGWFDPITSSIQRQIGIRALAISCYCATWSACLFTYCIILVLGFQNCQPIMLDKSMLRYRIKKKQMLWWN